MIQAYFATGGGGKSCSVIKYLLENHTQYKKLYINIEGFNIPLFRRATGNYSIKIIQFETKTYAKDLLMLMSDIKDDAEDLKEEDRDHTLFVYDEASFGLRDYSTRDDLSCEISNFIALHRHYGPCDMIFMTQGIKKIHDKFKEDIENYYEAVPFAKRTDPENDIVFDELDPDNLSKVLQGGASRIKFKKMEGYKDSFGQHYSYFDFYKSGDGGRAKKRVNGWKKYIYLLGFLVLFAIIMFYYVISSIFGSVSHDTNSTNPLGPVKVVSSEKINNSDDLISPNEKEIKDDTFNKYEKDYKKMTSQRLFRFFYHKKFYYVGDVVLSTKDFLFYVEDNAIRLLTKQSITKNSYYISAMVSLDVANALGLIKDFDFNAKSTNNQKMTLNNE